MELRELSIKEQAIIAEIEKQSKKHPDEPFCFDYRESQLNLNTRNDVAIDMSEQKEIIQKLSDDNIIDAEWTKPYTYRIDSKGYYNHNQEKISTKLAHEKDWAKLAFESDICFYDGFLDATFINIHPSQIETIKSSYAPACVASIVSANDPVALLVSCSFKDGHSEEYVIHTFKDEGLPHRIISYALKHQNKTILREELSQALKNKEGKSSIKSTINVAKKFERNNTINTVLAPFIKLGAEYILIKSDIKLTNLQYKILQEAAS